MQVQVSFSRGYLDTDIIATALVTVIGSSLSVATPAEGGALGCHLSPGRCLVGHLAGQVVGDYGAAVVVVDHLAPLLYRSKVPSTLVHQRGSTPHILGT